MLHAPCSRLTMVIAYPRRTPQPGTALCWATVVISPCSKDLNSRFPQQRGGGKSFCTCSLSDTSCRLHLSRDLMPRPFDLVPKAAECPPLLPVWNSGIAIWTWCPFGSSLKVDLRTDLEHPVFYPIQRSHAALWALFFSRKHWIIGHLQSFITNRNNTGVEKREWWRGWWRMMKKWDIRSYALGAYRVLKAGTSAPSPSSCPG